MKTIKRFLIILLIFVICGVGVFFYLDSKTGISVDYQVIGEEYGMKKLKIQAKSENFLNANLWISFGFEEKEVVEFDSWNLYSDQITWSTNFPFFYIKDEKGNIVEIEIIDENNIEFIYEANPYPVGYEFDIVENMDGIILYSDDENIAKIVNNRILTTGKGTVNITAMKEDYSITHPILVTDLYTLPNPDSDSKPFLTTTICDESEATMLDEILFNKIYEAGYKTRAGVVAAARFLSLEFPYKIAYFSESGRLDDTTGTKVSDGEGRYYHEGLYLSHDKFENIEASIFGKATWGEFFEEDDSDDHSLDDYYLYAGFTPADIGSHLYLSKRPNGLDCSGFVSWCYLNGGFDFGDMGAGGPDTYGMTNLGELVYINDELLQSDRIKAGDLVGYPSHIGIVIGVEDDYIWIADTLITGLKVTKYERNSESFAALGEEAFTYFILMDDAYKKDGKYTPMW